MKRDHCSLCFILFFLAPKFQQINKDSTHYRGKEFTLCTIATSASIHVVAMGKKGKRSKKKDAREKAEKSEYPIILHLLDIVN